MFTDYRQAVDYLYQSLPMFQRIGAAALKHDLSNTFRLCEMLGNPQHNFKSIHIAGTNGKGSTSHLLASVLQSAGYKTGLYTSPHLKEFTERIRVNGAEIDRDHVVDFVNRMQAGMEEIRPSFFETTVAMAFDYFAASQVDIAVIEVGLGGRLDSTNVITPLVSVITNISKDHVELLGDTLEKIAFEKAGIIKQHVPVVISLRQPEVEHVFREIAAKQQAPITFASDHYTIAFNQSETLTILKDGNVLMNDVSLPLKGHYQQKNLPGVLEAIEQLKACGFTLTDTAIRDGFDKVITQTGLKGRWQKLQDHPLTICDTGHNVDGVQQIVAQIREQAFEKLHMVIGMVKDKDISQVLALFPKEATYYFCQANIPRALDAYELAAKAKEAGLRGVVVPEVNKAVAAARKAATPNDFIFIGGSTFVVAEIENL